MLDAVTQRALADIKRFGWHLITVPDDDEGPGFVYSVGMMQTLNHPEIIMFGLEPDLMADVIDSMGNEVRAGRRFDNANLHNGLLKGYPCKTLPVAQDWHEEYLGYALWHRRHIGKPGTLKAIQCIWPDKAGLFPDNRKCDPAVIAAQPLLIK